MWVSDHTIDSALLRIYQEDKVYDNGGSLTYAELQHAWKSTGFRNADLDKSIQRLQELQCVRHEISPDRDVVVLLEEGEHRLRSLGSLFGDLQRGIGRVLFPRRPHPAAPGHSIPMRRRSDRELLTTQQPR